MILLLLNCSSGWCQNNSPTGDSIVSLNINYIKLANKKLIENKYNRKIILIQDSVINLHKIKYAALNSEVVRLQQDLHNSNKDISKLNKSLRVSKSRNKILGGIAGTSIIAFVICIILK